MAAERVERVVATVGSMAASMVVIRAGPSR
jgi:hypothetical protein